MFSQTSTSGLLVLLPLRHILAFSAVSFSHCTLLIWRVTRTRCELTGSQTVPYTHTHTHTSRNCLPALNHQRAVVVWRCLSSISFLLAAALEEGISLRVKWGIRNKSFTSFSAAVVRVLRLRLYSGKSCFSFFLGHRIFRLPSRERLFCLSSSLPHYQTILRWEE